MPVASSLLQVDRVSLAFDGVRALEDVSFSVHRGEVCALIGPNGAGKSSILNVVSGVYAPGEGTVRFEGEILDRAGSLAQRGIARTFQNIALSPGMTVLENVIAGADVRARATFLEQALFVGRAPGEERRARQEARTILSLLGIVAREGDVVGRLPYGLQKRVELARALILRPKLLLLDEPMAGMTFDEKRETCSLLIEAHLQLGTTLLLIEHDLGVVMDLSDHIVVLDYGRKIADGTPDDVRADPAVIQAYLGSLEN